MNRPIAFTLIVFADIDSLEIARYSVAGESNDPFAVLYIPLEWVKE